MKNLCAAGIGNIETGRNPEYGRETKWDVNRLFPMLRIPLEASGATRERRTVPVCLISTRSVGAKMNEGSGVPPFASALSHFAMPDVDRLQMWG